MDLLIAGRQMGKTTQAIEWVRNHDGILVCHNQREATRIFQNGWLEDRQITTVHKAVTDLSRGRTGVAPLAIDNLEIALQEVFGRVGYATMTATGRITQYGLGKRI